MASFWSLLSTMLILFIAYYSHSFSFPVALASSSSSSDIQFSTISAAPAILPGGPGPVTAPLPPSLSPDITPLFPTPGKQNLSPEESSLPTIPSSPSPPNPDDVVAPGPGMAFPPSGSMPASSASSSGSLTLALFLGFCWFFA
ncbi:classical arabinogalactan protein 26 [Cannabis sativa]|uniref:classical arabinogalactan protein 26 n=1 Tax=Cannabis sativa TaxID=3483 RepID=UPI0029CA8964|nr:classical arabinogalactan protein 26 [Cannabis sativa]